MISFDTNNRNHKDSEISSLILQIAADVHELNQIDTEYREICRLLMKLEGEKKFERIFFVDEEYINNKVRSEIENILCPAFRELTEDSQVEDFLNSSLFSLKKLKKMAQDYLLSASNLLQKRKL